MQHAGARRLYDDIDFEVVSMRKVVYRPIGATTFSGHHGERREIRRRSAIDACKCVHWPAATCVNGLISTTLYAIAEAGMSGTKRRGDKRR